MRWQTENGILELVTGDITTQEVDAIVNAANGRLAPGGGVCGAIHRAAGPELARACTLIGGCPTGEARVTEGFNLKARYVFHAVGPVYRGIPDDAVLLASCYRDCLKQALEMDLHSIAFPAISTGIYGYPPSEAARVALQTIVSFLEEGKPSILVKMVLFNSVDYETHATVLEEILADRGCSR